MKQSVIFGAVMAASVVVGASAQQTKGQGATQDAAKDAVKVSGCLATAAAGETTGGTGAAPTATGTTGGQRNQERGAQNQFLLTNASVSGTSNTTAGTGAATGASGTGRTYRLTGGNRAELQKYMNSMVEVRGTMQPQSNQGTGTGTGTGAGTGTAASAQAGGQATGNIATLRVTSVTQVAKTCDAR